MADTTVWVKVMDNLPVIKMTWGSHINISDVDTAFNQITEILEQSTQDTYVLIDLRMNPKFPLNPTLLGALLGSHQDPNLKGWLIVGANLPTRFIAHTLARLTDNVGVGTFNSEDEAVQYIIRQQMSSLRLAISRF